MWYTAISDYFFKGISSGWRSVGAHDAAKAIAQHQVLINNISFFLPPLPLLGELQIIFEPSSILVISPATILVIWPGLDRSSRWNSPVYCISSIYHTFEYITYPQWRTRQLGQRNVPRWARQHEFQRATSSSSEICRSGVRYKACGHASGRGLHAGHLGSQFGKLRRAIVQ